MYNISGVYVHAKLLILLVHRSVSMCAYFVICYICEYIIINIYCTNARKQ